MIINKILNLLGYKPVIIQVLDNISSATKKEVIIMAIFFLHNKFFEDVNFDNLFYNILDKLLTSEYHGGIGSYIDIASEIVVDNGISVEKLKKVLLNWIYNDPFFQREILIETPKAEVELLYPIANVTFSEL
jgi:hypothetical protein